MSSKRTPKRKLAVDSLVSTTGNKKPRASSTRKVMARSEEQQEHATAGQNGGSNATHVEWTHGEETVVTTTTITERTISLRNKTITTPALSRSTSKTSKKTQEATSAMDIVADDASWKDDGDGEKMELASMSDANDLATPVKRLYRRSSAGGSASVDDSASRPTNRRRISAGASAAASEHAHSQEVIPAATSSQASTAPATGGSTRRRKAPTGDKHSDAGSVASEAPSGTSTVKSARGRQSRGAASAQAQTVLAVTSHTLTAPAPSGASSASSSSSRSRASKQQVSQSSSVVAVENHTTTVVPAEPSLPAIVETPAVPAVVPQEPPAHDATPVETEPDAALESTGVVGGIHRRLRVVAGMAAQHYLSAVLVLLLLAVVLMYQQYVLQPSTVPMHPMRPRFQAPNQTTRDSNRTFVFPSLTTEELLADLLAQQEDLRRIGEQLGSARQQWNNASATAIETADLAAESHTDAQVLFVKMRQDNIVLEEQLQGLEQQLENHLKDQQRALQAETNASDALATKIEAELADLAPVIQELGTEARQLHSLVDAEVDALLVMAASLNVTATAGSNQTDLSAAHEAMKRTAEQIARSSAALNETEHGSKLSSAQAAVQAAEEIQEQSKQAFAAAQQKHEQDAAAVLEQTTVEAQKMQDKQDKTRAQQEAMAQELELEQVTQVIPEEPGTVHLSESASATAIKQAAAESLTEPLRRAKETVESAHNASLAETAEELQRQQETLLQDKLSQAAATEEGKNRKLPKLVHSEPEQVDVQGTDVAEVEEDLHQRHDYAVGPRGGQVLHHRYMCPAFGGSQLTSPPYTSHHGGGAGQPFSAITDALGSVVATFKRSVTHRGSVTSTGSTSRVSRHSAEARVLISHLRPVADQYYAMSTKRLHSATSTVHKVQGLLAGRGGDQADSQQEPYAGQVTIVLQEAVYVESVKLITATAPSAGSEGDEQHIQACAPETFRLVGWTEDPRKLRDTRGKQFDLGTHVFDSPQPCRDYGATDVSASITSGSGGSEERGQGSDQSSGNEVEGTGSSATSQVWEQQYAVPIEYDGVTIPALKAVTVHVLSNYGEKEFTCLHRVQIIGVLEQFLYP